VNTRRQQIMLLAQASIGVSAAMAGKRASARLSESETHARWGFGDRQRMSSLTSLVQMLIRRAGRPTYDAGEKRRKKKRRKRGSVSDPLG